MKRARVRKVLVVFLNGELLKHYVDYESYANFIGMVLDLNHASRGRLLREHWHERALESLIL